MLKKSTFIDIGLQDLLKTSRNGRRDIEFNPYEYERNWKGTGFGFYTSTETQKLDNKVNLSLMYTPSIPTTYYRPFIIHHRALENRLGSDDCLSS